MHQQWVTYDKPIHNNYSWASAKLSRIRRTTVKTLCPSPGSFRLVARAILACVIPFIVGSAPAQDERTLPRVADINRPVYINGEPVYRVGPGVKAPRPLYTPDPEYSEEARKAKLQGRCVLWLVVGADGKTSGVRIAHSLGMGLDEKSIEAIRTWRFEPAIKGGQPVAIQMNVETSFRLYPSPEAGIPETLEPLARSTHGFSLDRPFTFTPQAPDYDAAGYSLLVEVRFVTGQKAKEGYVVNAEATIPERGQQRKATISCGPKGNCFMLNWGKYPARWLSANEMELLGRNYGDGAWQKVKFSVVPIVENRGPN